MVEDQGLRLAWRVAFESDVPVIAGNWQVDVDAATGAVLAAADNSAESHTRFTRIANAFVYNQDALDNLDASCNPLAAPSPPIDCFDAYAGALVDARLFLLDDERTDLHGQFARVTNADVENAEQDFFGYYGFQSVVAAVNCRYYDPAIDLSVDPLFPDRETLVFCEDIFTADEESHHDEVLAYHYISEYAFGLSSIYGWNLSRGSGVPNIPVRVNHSSEWPNAKFLPGCTSGFLGFGGGCSPKIKIGDGDRWKWIANDHFGPPVDHLVRRDNGKEADVPIHEYAHAILWDKGIEFGGRFTKAVHEGHADFLAADVLGQDVHGRWTRNRERQLDPAIDLAYPQNLECPPEDLSCPNEEHAEGQIWSGALWDFRNRGREIVAAGLVAAPGHSPDAAVEVSALSFYFADHAPQSFDYSVSPPSMCVECGFRPALVSLLTTDHARFDGRYTYEILAAFAQHGIQLEEPIAVISPVTLVTNATTSNVDLAFRAFLGTNDEYVAIFSPFAKVVRGDVPAVFNPTLPGFNALIAFGTVGGGLGGGGPVEPLLATSPAGTQNTALIELDGDLVRTLADLSFRNPAPMYARVFTFSDADPDADTDSYIPDAGEFIVNGDSPFALYATPTPVPGCGCRSVGGDTKVGGSFAVIALFLLTILRRVRS